MFPEEIISHVTKDIPIQPTVRSLNFEGSSGAVAVVVEDPSGDPEDGDEGDGEPSSAFEGSSSIWL